MEKGLLAVAQGPRPLKRPKHDHDSAPAAVDGDVHSENIRRDD
jgi:hypothetical protein